MERISFVKDKIVSYPKGPTGVTATTESGSKVFGEAEIDREGRYSSSNLLNQNIDKLAQTLGFIFPENKVERNESVSDYSDYSELTEQEVIENLDEHLNYFDSNPAKSNKNDNFCRKCGQKYASVDNFCANCGNRRNLKAFI